MKPRVDSRMWIWSLVAVVVGFLGCSATLFWTRRAELAEVSARVMLVSRLVALDRAVQDLWLVAPAANGSTFTAPDAGSARTRWQGLVRNCAECAAACRSVAIAGPDVGASLARVDSLVEVMTAWHESTLARSRNDDVLGAVLALHEVQRRATEEVQTSVRAQRARLSELSLLLLRRWNILHAMLVLASVFAILALTLVQILKRDLERRRRAENALRDSEQRFRKIFEEGPLGMALIDPDHRYLRVNAALCRMLGYSAEELVGRTFLDMTHPEDLGKSLSVATSNLQSEQPFGHMEKRYVRKDGGILHASVFGSYIRDDAGRPLYSVAQVEDITEQRRAAMRVQALEEERRQTERRQRMRVVQAQDAERLQFSCELHEEVGQILTGLEMSLAAKNRGRMLLDEEIALTRSAASRAVRLSRLLSPPELEIDGVCAVVRQHLCGPEPPGGDAACVDVAVLGAEPDLTREHKSLLFRIVQEAVTNAVQHARPAHVRIRFDWRLESLLLTIEDDGVGMSEVVTPGVGLSSIVDRALVLGGELRWERIPADGTRLRLEVPLEPLLSPADDGEAAIVPEPLGSDRPAPPA